MSGLISTPFAQPQSLEQSLKHFFGYDSFRPGQREIIDQALQKRDLLIIMPHRIGHILIYVCTYLFKVEEKKKKALFFKERFSLRILSKEGLKYRTRPI